MLHKKKQTRVYMKLLRSKQFSNDFFFFYLYEETIFLPTFLVLIKSHFVCTIGSQVCCSHFHIYNWVVQPFFFRRNRYIKIFHLLILSIGGEIFFLRVKFAIEENRLLRSTAFIIEMSQKFPFFSFSQHFTQYCKMSPRILTNAANVTGSQSHYNT